MLLLPGPPSMDAVDNKLRALLDLPPPPPPSTLAEPPTPTPLLLLVTALLVVLRKDRFFFIRPMIRSLTEFPPMEPLDHPLVMVISSPSSPAPGEAAATPPRELFLPNIVPLAIVVGHRGGGAIVWFGCGFRAGLPMRWGSRGVSGGTSAKKKSFRILLQIANGQLQF